MLTRTDAAVPRPAGSMCRHKGIGMNRPKKKKVQPSGMLKVSLILRGIDLENVTDAPAEQDQADPGPGSLFDWRQEWLRSKRSARRLDKLVDRYAKMMARAEKLQDVNERMGSSTSRTSRGSATQGSGGMSPGSLKGMSML